MALVRKRVVNVLLCHRLMTRRPNCPRLRPGDADPLVTCDTWRKPAAQAQKTELERQLKEAKDEARIPSSGASDSSFHRTSTSIIRGSLYSNLTAVDAYGQNSQQSGWVWLQTKIIKKPWASILGESYSNLFRLKSYVSFSFIFIIVALSHWSAPVWNYSPQWVPTRLPHIFMLNSQGRRPLCEI
jgi:hypothetical protein